ncbi:hypothetical protein GH714_008081 [Hevea brasiliensis]|uniref:Uncharacterized protein n=1 Tax=Hevea brasiliensis TaxID=3981 RepID=A0A6A6L9R2_HEVBR|nr:hypothetical protein GH714_008081 [Hevea brasiliensis]
MHALLQMRFVSRRMRLKHCGFRAIYSQDVDEMVLCGKPSENLGLPCNHNVDKARETNRVESNESGNLTDRLPSKRPRMLVDPDTETHGQKDLKE